MFYQSLDSQCVYDQLSLFLNAFQDLHDVTTILHWYGVLRTKMRSIGNQMYNKFNVKLFTFVRYDLNGTLLILIFSFISFESMLKLCSVSPISHLFQCVFNLCTQESSFLAPETYGLILWFKVCILLAGGIFAALSQIFGFNLETLSVTGRPCLPLWWQWPKLCCGLGGWSPEKEGLFVALWQALWGRYLNETNGKED